MPQNKTASSFFQTKFTPVQWGIIIAVFAVALATVFRNYLSLDEADLMWDIKSGTNGYGGFDRFVSEGRPIYGFFVMTSIRLIGNLENLKYLRILTILCTLSSCFLLFAFLKNNGVNQGVSFLIAIAVFTLPSFSVFLCWAECFPDHISFILSFLSGMLALKVFAKHIGGSAISKGRENLYIFLSIVIEIIALFNYQTLALAFLLPPFFMLILKSDVPTKKRIVFFTYISVVFILSLGLYYKIYQSILFSSGIPITSRAKFTTNPLEKIQWYLIQLHAAGEFHLLLFKNELIRYVAITPLVYILVRDIVKKRFLDIALLLIVCTFLFIPMLLLDENWGASRNITLVSVAIIFYFLTRVFELLPAPSSVVLVPTSALLICLMYFNMSTGWAQPQHEDYVYVKNFTEGLPVLKNGDSIRIKVLLAAPNFHEKESVLMHCCDEFNDPIFSNVWAIAPAIREFYKEKHGDIPFNAINKQMKIDLIKDTVQFSSQVVGNTFYLNLNYK